MMAHRIPFFLFSLRLTIVSRWILMIPSKVLLSPAFIVPQSPAFSYHLLTINFFPFIVILWPFIIFNVFIHPPYLNNLYFCPAFSV